MKKLLQNYCCRHLWIVLFCLASATCPAAGPDTQAVLAPDWALDTSDGRDLRFHQDAADTPAVLLFWASWCPYCAKLFPHLEALWREYGPRGVRFYALNVWEDSDPVAYFAEHGYTMPLLLAADLVGEDYGIKGTPGLLVTNRDQHIVYQRQRGAEPAAVAARVRAALEAALAASAAPR